MSLSIDVDAGSATGSIRTDSPRTTKNATGVMFTFARCAAAEGIVAVCRIIFASQNLPPAL